MRGVPLPATVGAKTAAIPDAAGRGAVEGAVHCMSKCKHVGN